MHGRAGRSSGHIAYARAARKEKATHRKLVKTREQQQALGRFWNRQRLRLGDAVVDPAQSHLPHPNTWSLSQVLAQAWMQIGYRKRVVREGLEGHRRGLQVLSTVAGAVLAHQESLVHEVLARLRLQGGVPVVIRCFDASPKKLSFGRLHEELLPCARRAQGGNVRLSGQGAGAGVLEELVQSIHLAWRTEDGGVTTFQPFCPPKILESCNSSCLFDAVIGSVANWQLVHRLRTQG